MTIKDLSVLWAAAIAPHTIDSRDVLLLRDLFTIEDFDGLTFCDSFADTLDANKHLMEVTQ